MAGPDIASNSESVSDELKSELESTRGVLNYCPHERCPGRAMRRRTEGLIAAGVNTYQAWGANIPDHRCVSPAKCANSPLEISPPFMFAYVAGLRSPGGTMSVLDI